MDALLRSRWLRWIWPGLVLVVALLLLTVVFSFTSPTLQRIATSAIINLIAVVGLYVFVGSSGVFSFSAVGFMAIGAYACGVVSLSVKTKALLMPDMPGFLAGLSLPTIVSILFGGAVAALFALVVAFPLMRMRAIALPIATFALLVVIHTITIGWVSVTGGTNTMTGLPIDTTLWLTFAFASAAMLVALVFQQSRIGMRLKACREEEVAARAAGIGVVKERIWAWLISAFMVGIAGGLYAHHLGMLNPDAFWFSQAILVTVMLIVGGMRSLAGAFIGTLGISVISELLYRVEQGIVVGPIHLPARPGLKELVYSAILILVLIWRRQGIMGSREFQLPRPRALPTEQAAPEEKGAVPETNTD